MWGTYMKTTVEISDELLERSRALAQREGSTLRALLEEGLHLALTRRTSRARPEALMLPGLRPSSVTWVGQQFVMRSIACRLAKRTRLDDRR
jgi:hypothetical protein